MSTLADPQVPGKMGNFPGPIGTKRRRMRSGGNVSTATNNAPKQLDEAENISEQKTTQTSKCKGATTIPIFLKKTYKMVDTCDPAIASWTEDGESFVVKDPDIFAAQVIPQYFDHNKFSSFARQLNFYGFRKMQSKPIRNKDFDEVTAKHVTFHNENFKRGRCDLLKKIQRSTRGGGDKNSQDHAKEIAMLREQVSTLEQKLEDMAIKTEDRVRRLELDMLARMEQMMLAVQQQQRTQLQLEKATSVGTMNSSSQSSSGQASVPNQFAGLQPPAPGVTWNTSLSYPRGNSISSAVNSVANAVGSAAQFQVPAGVNSNVAGMNNNNNSHTNNTNLGPPTLPPHPKQKQLPVGMQPPMGAMPAPPDRLNSLRGISTLSRGMSGLTRGASEQSSASAVLMRNSWEDKFFSMLMLDGNGEANGGESNGGEPDLSPTPINEAAVGKAPVTVSRDSTAMAKMETMPESDGGGGDDDDFSDVSNPDMS